MYPAQCWRGDLPLGDPADRHDRQDGRQSHAARVTVGAHPPFFEFTRDGAAPSLRTQPGRGHRVPALSPLPSQRGLRHPAQLIRALRRGLREIQYRSNLIDGCLASTELTRTTSRMQPQ